LSVAFLSATLVVAFISVTQLRCRKKNLGRLEGKSKRKTRTAIPLRLLRQAITKNRR